MGPIVERARRLPSADPPRRITAGEAGLSFVELLVTILLLALVVGGVLPLLTAGSQAYDETERRQTMIQNARTALDRLLREMRAAQSFRAVAPGLAHFTLAWGDGSGALPTVEYALNGITNDLEYRWSAGWDYRQQMVVTAVNAVPAGYAVAVTFSHAALVAAGKSLASGDDVRIRYESGGTSVELDRVLDPTSGWSPALTTTLWFRLQTPLAAAGIDGGYYLYYGNLSAGAPPANGDNVFLDYENGTTLDGWTRRDARPGGYTWSATDGFIFTAAATNGFREQSKNVPNSNVEIFWGFRVGPGSNVRQAGVGARLSNTGRGYRLTPGHTLGGNQLRIRFWNGWAGTGGGIGTSVVAIVPNNDYFGRFYLVGNSIRAKAWLTILPEPAWQTIVVNNSAASGNHYSLVNGETVPLDHRQRTLIVRPRVALEPVVLPGLETPGTLANALAPLAGPFRSMTVTCFDAASAAVPCIPTTPVRSVQVALVAMDPDGRIPDITVTGRAYRQHP